MSQPVGPRPLRDGGADGIGQRGDVLDAARHGLDTCSHRAPADRAWRPTAPLARAASMSRAFAANNSGTRARKRRGDGAQRAVLGGGARQRQRRGGGRRRRARAHCMTAAISWQVGGSTAAFTGYFSRNSGRQVGAHHHQIVAMDQLVAAAKTEQRFDVGAAFADDAHGVAIAVGDQAARDLVAVAIEHAHGIAARESPAHRDHTGRQQALARTQRLQRAGIDGHCTARAQRTGDPLLACILGILRRQEPAALGALFEAPHRMHRRTRRRWPWRNRPRVGDLRGRDLGRHAARAHRRGRAASHGLDLRRDLAHFGNQPRRRIAVRIGGIQPGDVRQQQQAIRARSSARHAPPGDRCRRSGFRWSPPCRSR